MPVSSRNERRKRRVRRNLSLTRKVLRQTSGDFQRVYSMLLFALAQAGGEVTVTTGTMQQVLPKLGQLNVVLVPGAAENERILRLIDSSEPHTDAPAETPADSVTITRVPDDPDAAAREGDEVGRAISTLADQRR